MSSAIALTSLIGVAVLAEDGRRLGVLADIGADLATRQARVTGFDVRTQRHERAHVTPQDVAEVDAHRLRLRPGARLGELADGGRLARDVLDAQVLDVAARRIGRVGEVVLEPRPDGLHVVGVDLGLAPVLRRLGLRWLARAVPEDLVAWQDVHRIAGPVHALQLEGTVLPPRPRRYRILHHRRRAPA